MRLYFIRHGQRNLGERFDTLTWIGIEQSKRLGPYFKDKKINFVYCSPQKRAKNTLKYIKPYLSKNIEINISQRVRQKSAPDEVGEDVVKKLHLKEDTDFELGKRVQKFLELIKKNHKDKDNILISTHKMFIISAICRLLNLPPTEEIYIRKIPSSSVTYFELDKNFKVKDFKIGDITHLVKFTPKKIKDANKKEFAAEPSSTAVISNKNFRAKDWLKSEYPVKEIKKDKKEIYYKIDFS